MDEHYAAPNDAAWPHEIEVAAHPLAGLGAALSDTSLQARAAAVVRSQRLPDPSLMLSAWHTLPGSLQTQIGTAALTHSFYSLAPEVPGRELTLPASYRCEAVASEALTLVDGIAKAALPELYGTEEQEPEWALSNTPMVFTDPLTTSPTPISLAITLHRRAWQTLQASDDLFVATGRTDRRTLVWPALEAEDEALTDLLMLSVRSRQDAANLVAHLRWYLGVGSQHPVRPSPVEADRGLIAARLADLGLVLGEEIAEAAQRIGSEVFRGLLAQHRAAWSAYSEAARAVAADGWDALAPLSSAAHAAAEAVLRAPCGNDRAEAEALVAHAGWYAAALAEDGEEVGDGLEFGARRLSARAGDVALWGLLGDGAMLADGGAVRSA